MKTSRSKTKAIAIALFLVFAMAVSLVALPFANAQTYEIYINNYGTKVAINSEVQIRLEVRQDGTRIQHVWENVTLHVRAPGSSSWTIVGPMNTPSNGRLDYYYTVTAVGTYQFMWNVPAQAELPTNPETSDGSWYSAITETQVVLRIEASTYAFINAVPNPAGVNQEVLLHIGITQQLQIDGMQWEGLSVTIERPDGKIDKIEDVSTDSTGGTGRTYVPDIAGNYTLVTHFPEQQTTSTKRSAGHSVGSWMLASDSWPLTLVVTEEHHPVHPGYPLPTEYWTRPIDAQLREWHTIAGSSWETDYNQGPESAHILWGRPNSIGGVAGGEYADNHAFDIGDAYAGEWNSRFIIAGIALTETDDVWDPKSTIANDIHTGEELWRLPFTFSFGQIYYHTSMNRHCAYAYMWRQVGQTLMAYDPWSSQWVYNITNRPSGSRTFGPSGELLYYSVSLSGGYMRVWNSSWAYMEGKTGMSMAWNVEHSTIDAATRGWQEDITIPEGLTGSVRSVDFVKTKRVVGTSTAANYSDVKVWAFSLEPGSEGQLLYSKSATNPEVWADSASFSNGPLDVEYGVFTIWSKELRQWWGYSLETGKQLWGPTEPEHYLNIYDKNHQTKYGMLYSSGVSGEIKCYNITTGELLWTYHAADPYSEILWNNAWWMHILWITDGKLYASHEEHSPIDPLPRGAPFVCLNATTGDVIWRADGLFRGTHWGGRAIIGESIILTQDTFNQYTYAIGKGPSAMTVTADPKVSVHGNSVLVEGVVTDVSPGTNDVRIQLRFPNGVPAVGDESMSEWMGYVYKQFTRPADVVGVEVVISVFDPNNNYYEVGKATANADGVFGFAFEPLVPGTYEVIAEFEGSRAYYGSHATTYITVEEAPAATPEPTPTPAPMTDTYVLGIGAGAIIAIIAIGLVIILMLRKR